jgi:hypothetical protein
MRNIFLIILIGISSLYVNSVSYLFARTTSPINSTTSNTQKYDQRLNILHELFTTLGINVAPSYEAMNTYAQANWLRKPNQERWDMEKLSHHPNIDKIIPILQQLRMIERIDPSIYAPDYAVILGATVYRMRTRMQHMLELISAGRFKPKQIVVLTGDRPLDPIQESSTVLMDKKFIRSNWECFNSLPTTESEAAKLVWDQLPKPDCIQEIPITFLNTPMLDKNGKSVRPTTPDTLNSWLKTAPTPGTIIAFSNNPYILYQNETIKPILIKAGWFKAGGVLETVGTEFTSLTDDNVVPQLLDNVARYIYSIIQVEQALVSQ